MCRNDKEYNSNLNKKLHYLSLSLMESILLSSKVTKEELLFVAYSSLLRKGAHYLKLNSLQVIKEFLESADRQLSFDNLKSKFSFNLVYIDRHVIEKYNYNM